MKRIISMLACAALIVCSCQKDPKPEVSFTSGNYVMGADEALTVKVVTDMAPAADLTIEFTTSGTAVLGSDYELSAEAVTIKAGETEGEITVTPLNNLGSNLNINLALTLPAGYEAGKFTSAVIALASKEKITYTFAKSETKLVSEVDIVLNLLGETSGSDFVAGGDFTIPFIIDETSTATATEYEVKDGATAFIFAKGEKSAKITLVSKLTEVPADAAKNIVIKIDDAAIANAYGNRFTQDGVYKTITAVMTSLLMFDDLEGKWAYASSPLVDDASVDKMMLDMMFEESGDNLDTYPTGTTDDILEFKVKEGQTMLIPAGSGSVLNYFRECEVSGFTPGKFQWYYYNDTGSTDDMGREYDIVVVNLSKANTAYSATTNTEEEAKIYLNLSEDGNTLNIFITEYTPTDFLQPTYIAMEMMGMLEMYPMLFDLYFTFTRVE